MRNLSPIDEEKDLINLEYADEIKSATVINKTALGVQRKNLLEVTASTQTVNGITFTVNNDGSITANGTCTALMTVFAGSFTAQSGVKYTLSGCPSGGGISSYGLTARRAIDESIDKADDWGEGKTFTGDGYTYNIRMRIAKGAVLDNIVFYPMVRYADITDDTFEQYKPSINTQGCRHSKKRTHSAASCFILALSARRELISPLQICRSTRRSGHILTGLFRVRNFQ